MGWHGASIELAFILGAWGEFFLHKAVDNSVEKAVYSVNRPRGALAALF
jgi:hypothetical protein